MKRFWEKVDRSSPDRCWDWKASLNIHGYGQFRLEGKMRRAHRVAWQITRGDIPKGLCVCHRCDRPICVNPEHLYLASHAQNMADMSRKGRADGHGNKPGEKHPMARLTESNVIDIRRRRSHGQTLDEIAGVYGISFGHVSDIVLKRRWRHI